MARPAEAETARSEAARLTAGLRAALALQTVTQRTSGPAASSVRRFFARQADAAAARVLGQFRLLGEVKATPGEVIPAADAEVLIRALLPHRRRAALMASAIAAELVKMPALTDADAALRQMLARGGDRIRRINANTRDAVRRTLDQGMTDQLTDRALAARVRQVVRETYTGRANAIARTEMALAEQAAAHERYAAAGIQKVRILDGPECGWTSHDDPDLANGSTRTMAEAEAQPLSHPNCRRASVPVI